MLERNVPYIPKGRFETEEQSKQVDMLIQTKLNEWDISHFNTCGSLETKVNFILNVINSKGNK